MRLHLRWKTSQPAVSVYGYMPCYEAMPKARQAAQHALALDPSLAEGHAPLVFVSFIYDWEWGRTRREFDSAMALDPRMVSALNYARAREDRRWRGRNEGEGSAI